MRSQSRTKTSIWSDSDFLKRSARAQRLYWMLYSQPTISLCGVVALTERRWAASAADETLETVRSALDELDEYRFVLVDWDTEEILVRTFARHDSVKPGSRVWTPAWLALCNVASPALRATAERELRRLGEPPEVWSELPETMLPVDNFSAGAEGSSGPGTKLLVDTPSDTPSDGVSDTPSRTVPHTPSGTPRALRAPPLPPSPALKSQSPSAHARAEQSENRDVVLRTETRDSTTALGLAQRIAELCVGKNRRRVNTEAAAVTTWALTHVDVRIVDEAIGWATTNPPALPRAVAAVIQAKAADRGINMPEFTP